MLKLKLKIVLRKLNLDNAKESSLRFIHYQRIRRFNRKYSQYHGKVST